MSNDQMQPQKNILDIVVGYQEAVAVKDQLEKTGSDFSEQRGQVKRTINSLHPKRLSLEVVNIIEDTPTCKTFRMASIDQPLPPFQAGQYINLFVNIDGVFTARPYAISSPPTQRDYYDLTVKRASGGFVSNYLLDKVEVGQFFTSSGPMGTFHHNPLFHGDKLVFFAGGSGIAPAMSMVENLLGKNLKQSIHIIYSNSYEKDVIFADHLRQLADQHSNITLSEFITRPSEHYEGKTGRISLEEVKALVSNPESCMYYICGPTPFNEQCADILKQLNVKERRILVEANGAPKSPDKMEGWNNQASPEKEITVSIRGHGSFKAKAGEPLLNSMERNGYSAENACRSGECSLCRVKLVSGEVFNPPESRIRKSDKQYGWIHACVAFPNSDIEIQI